MASSDFHTIGPVAARLGVQRWLLAYLIERGEVPGPSLQVPGRRLFTDEDVLRIGECLEARARSRRAPAAKGAAGAGGDARPTAIER